MGCGKPWCMCVVFCFFYWKQLRSEWIRGKTDFSKERTLKIDIEDAKQPKKKIHNSQFALQAGIPKMPVQNI